MLMAQVYVKVQLQMWQQALIELLEARTRQTEQHWLSNHSFM